jgi:hypothetical protein
MKNWWRRPQVGEWLAWVAIMALPVTVYVAIVLRVMGYI